MDHDAQNQCRDVAVPNFSRDVHCLFGLPFDVVTVDQAADHIMAAVRSGRRCVLSTPNLNIAVAAQIDSSFRSSLIRSDLCVVDGMPLVWAGRCLGVPFSERVPGSGLFEHLRRQAPGQPVLKVYLFGGGDGVAAAAAHALNTQGGSVRCVGYASPGFGTVASMSSPDILDAINASGADFLLVALGAKKGQAWIEHNLPRLAPPVVSYLGAVINFVAGTVRRAPRWMQQCGLEWLWRISQEKGLIPRYWNDGLQALGLIIRNILPGLIPNYLSERRHADNPASLEISESGDEVRFLLRGAWVAAALPPLRQSLNRYADTHKRLRFDMRRVTYVGSGFVALMVILQRYRHDAGRDWCMEQVSAAVMGQLRLYGAANLPESGEIGR